MFSCILLRAQRRVVAAAQELRNLFDADLRWGECVKGADHMAHVAVAYNLWPVVDCAKVRKPRHARNRLAPSGFQAYACQTGQEPSQPR